MKITYRTFLRLGTRAARAIKVSVSFSLRFVSAMMWSSLPWARGLLLFVVFVSKFSFSNEPFEVSVEWFIFSNSVGDNGIVSFSFELLGGEFGGFSKDGIWNWTVGERFGERDSLVLPLFRVGLRGMPLKQGL